MAGHQEERLADEELHREVGAGRRFDLHRPRLVDRLPERLRRRHRILQPFRLGGYGAGDHPLVGIDDGCFDHRAAFDQPLEQLVGRRGVANPVDAQALQGAGNGGDVAQDFVLARAPHRLADRARRLVGGLRGLHHEVGQVDHQQRKNDRHDQGGRNGEDAAHQHQAHVQARARRAAPAVEPELREPHREQRDQRDGDHEIGHQQAGEPAPGVEGERREAGQPSVGGGAGQDGEHGQRDGRSATAKPAADRAHRIAQA